MFRRREDANTLIRNTFRWIRPTSCLLPGGRSMALRKSSPAHRQTCDSGFNHRRQPTRRANHWRCARACSAGRFIKIRIYPRIYRTFPGRGHTGELDETSLVRILKEPKNALIRQYQKLFEFDHVKLHFKDEALEAIAEEALELKWARGTAVNHGTHHVELMFEIPSQTTIRECIISEDVILHGAIRFYCMRKPVNRMRR